jgi:DNA-binding PadR family transcriptional regulator
MTLQTLAVLQAFLDANRELYGLEISQSSGLAAGTIYPILQRLDVAGWVRSRWENDGDAHAERRPPRRYYQLSPEGRARAVHALDSTARQRGALARILALPQQPKPGYRPSS